MADRFDYIGFANGGKEVGPQPADSVVLNQLEGVARMMAIPILAGGDIVTETANKIGRAGNWALGKLTGYEVPYDPALPNRMSDNNMARLKEIGGNIAMAAGMRPVPQPASSAAVSDATTKNGNVGLDRMGPKDLSRFSNGALPVPRAPGASTDANMERNIGLAFNASGPVSSSQAIPGDPALTPVGSFQVEGGRKRTFSTDGSGAWYEGGKPMGGIMGAGRRGGNPAVDDIVNKLLAGRSGYGGGVALPGDEIAGSAYRSQVEHAMQVNAANGFAPTLEQIRTTGMSPADLVHLLGSNNRNGRYDRQIDDIFKNELMENARGKLDLERMMTPVEMMQRLAQGDMYRAHGDYFKAMSDPTLQLKLKGKDAETEAMKSRGEILKTILPKAYESADAQTKAYLEANPTADRKAVWNSAFNNSLEAFTDQFSTGKRYAEGVHMPGKSSWFGYNAPEVNIPGGWVDPAMNNLYSVTAQALQAAGDDGLKRTKIMNRFNEMVRELRGRSQGIPTQ